MARPSATRGERELVQHGDPLMTRPAAPTDSTSLNLLDELFLNLDHAPEPWNVHLQRKATAVGRWLLGHNLDRWLEIYAAHAHAHAAQITAARKVGRQGGEAAGDR